MYICTCIHIYIYIYMCILTICTAHLHNVWLGWPAALQRVFSMCRPDALQRAWEEPARGTKPPELCVYCIPCTVCPGQSGNQPPAHNFQLPRPYFHLPGPNISISLGPTLNSYTRLPTSRANFQLPGPNFQFPGPNFPIPGAQLSIESWALGVESWTRELKVGARELTVAPWGLKVRPGRRNLGPRGWMLALRNERSDLGV